MPALIAMPAEFVSEPSKAGPEAAASFTLDGSDELEQQLERTCETIRIEIQKIIPSYQLEGLLLGGGYGRGEGGVLRMEGGDRPYNDLEFYVFIRGNHWLNERWFNTALQRLAHELAPVAGIEVEFKIISSVKLRRSPPSMFYYDLIAGHRCLLGAENMLAGCEHHCDARKIPLSEATRLLMNRCSGLLFAREKLEQVSFNAADADFVGRNLAKAQLAFGDAVLTVFGQYHWSCLKRHERIRRLAPEIFPWYDTLRDHHAAGLRFKLHPYQAAPAQAELKAQHDATKAFALKTWLWLESRRLGNDFISARDYALNLQDKCPDTNPWRNRLVNAKAFGPSAFFVKRSRRHPRERVLNALAWLLWEPLAQHPEALRWLDKKSSEVTGLEASWIDIYRRIWRQFS